MDRLTPDVARLREIEHEWSRVVAKNGGKVRMDITDLLEFIRALLAPSPPDGAAQCICTAMGFDIGLWGRHHDACPCRTPDGAAERAAPKSPTLKDFGFAQGDYMVGCAECGAHVAGLDKRAYRCLACAQKLLDAWHAAGRTPQPPAPAPARSSAGDTPESLRAERDEARMQRDGYRRRIIAETGRDPAMAPFPTPTPTPAPGEAQAAGDAYDTAWRRAAATVTPGGALGIEADGRDKDFFAAGWNAALARPAAVTEAMVEKAIVIGELTAAVRELVALVTMLDCGYGHPLREDRRRTLALAQRALGAGAAP